MAGEQLVDVGEQKGSENLNAMAAAVTGLLGQGRLRTLPEPPPLDDRGLPMEMVYYLPER